MINSIPNYMTSQDEMGLYVAFEAEKSFNEMMEGFGLAELHSIEETGVIQEAKAETIKDKFIAWLNTIWEGIKKLANKVLDWLKAQMDKIKKKLSEIAEKSSESLKKKAEKLNDKTKDGKKKTFGKVHTWDGFNDIVEMRGPVWAAVNVFDVAFDKIPGVLNRNDKGEDTYESINKNVRTKLGVRDLSADSIQSKVKKIVEGKDMDADKQYIVSNWDDIFTYATDFGRTSSKLKKSLNETKKNLDNTKKEFEQFMKKFGDTNDGTLQCVVTNIKKSKIVLTGLQNAILSCVKARSSESMGLVLRVAVAGKQKEEKATNESAVSSSFQTELASLFEM